MKISSLLVILYFSVSSAFAQSYKIKKDVVYKDKVAIAKLEGSVNLTKVDLSISTLKDTPILKVEGHTFSDVQPDMESIYWYTFTFPEFDRKFTIQQTANYLGTKQFLKLELARKGVHFYEDGFKLDELDGLQDYSTQLKEDTLKLLEKINFYTETLSSGKIERPLSEPVAFRNYTTIKGLVITQGYRKNEKDEDIPIIIGRISYYKNEGQSISDPSRSHRITVYKKMPTEVTIDGYTSDFVAAGYIDLLEGIPSLYLYQNNRSLGVTEFKIGDRNIEDAKRAAKFMVKNGWL